MTEQGKLQGVLCLIGGVLSQARYEQLPCFLFFTSRQQNVVTISAGIVHVPQV